MKKRIINISLIIVGILVVSMIGTKAATAIQSSMVTYNNTTVKETLDDLVDITVQGDASAEDITEGKTAVVKGQLITGTKNSSIDLSNVPTVTTIHRMGSNTINIQSVVSNWADLTVDNFYIKSVSGSGSLSSSSTSGSAVTSVYISSYDNTTGILTVYTKFQISMGNGISMQTVIAIIGGIV